MSEENYNEILQNDQMNETDSVVKEDNKLGDISANNNTKTDNNQIGEKINKDVRQARIKRIKNYIIYAFVLLAILPTILCIICFAKISSLENEIANIKDQIVMLIETQTESHTEEEVVETEDNLATPSENIIPEQVEQIVENIKKKKVCLTFDDGPSVNTDAILDVLDTYDVKATFFVIGKKGFDQAFKRIAQEGHTLGMHSYSHKYDVIYKDLDAFAEDVESIQSYIKEVTGEECKYYRFPGGSSNTVSKVNMEYCIAYLLQEGIDYVDWNISSEDAAGATSVTELVDNVIGQIENSKAETLVILMHDSKDKTATVEALPIIIDKIKAMDDVEIVPITEDVNLVQHVVIDESEIDALMDAMNTELHSEQDKKVDAVSGN